MAGENNNPTGGDRGLEGKTPSIADQISTFKGMSADDGVVKTVQDGVTPVVDPDLAGGEGEGEGGDGLLPPMLTEKAPTTPAKPKSAQERINEAVKKQRAAERALEAERANGKAIIDRLDRLEKGLAPAPLTRPNVSATNAPVDASAPDPSKYQFGDLDPRYLADLARHEATKILGADKAEREAARKAEADRAAKERIGAAVNKLTTDGTAAYPDFKAVVFDDTDSWDLTQTVGELAFDSDVGAHVLYHLATNPEESKAVAKLPPAKQAAWFGKMEAFFAPKSAKSPAAANGQGDASSATPPARMTQAPTPPERRVRGNNGNPNPVTPDTTDFKAFERLALGRQN